MDRQYLFNLRQATVMPDGQSVAAARGGRELLRQRVAGHQQRYPSHASYLRYAVGANYVRSRNVHRPSPQIAILPPGAPTSVTAVAANSQATVSFTPPINNGGNPITTYTVTSTPGGFTTTGPTSPLTVTGLTNGTLYTFTVIATNGIGPSQPSAASIAVTPIGVPSAPTIQTVTRGNQQVTIVFNVPADNGGASITNYKYSINDGVTWIPRTPANTTSPLTITGLTNGTTYQIKLLAINAAGDGAASASSSVTPATTPAAPTGLSSTPASGQVTVSFTPGSDGGSPITNYQYSTDNGLNYTAFNPLIGAVSSVVITGLINSTTYTVRLKAMNAIGTGTASAPISVTPAGGPPAPTALSGVGGDQAIYVLFTQSSNGGSAITNYEYSVDNGTTFTAFIPAQTFSPVMISGIGLTNGTSYDVLLKAVNASGTGPESTSISVTPTTNSLLSANRLINLDATNSSSYSGSGTAWTNLDSGGLYSATLQNGPTYDILDSANKYFRFNGVNQIAEIAAVSAINPTTTLSFTVQIWARVNTASPNFGPGDGLISKQYGLGPNDYDGYSFTLSTDTRVFLNMNGASVNGNYASSAGAYSNGWALYTIVVDFGGSSGSPSYAYVSTRRVVTGNNAEGGTIRAAPLQFPRGIQDSGSNFCPADVGAFYLYNTILTQAQIIQNYDATKIRYGL